MRVTELGNMIFQQFTGGFDLSLTLSQANKHLQ